MMRLLSISILIFLTLVSCNKDNESQQTLVQALVISSFSPETAYVGDEVVLIAQNIYLSTNYTVKINGILADDIVTTSASIKARIPSGASTGDLTVEYDETILMVGSVTIKQPLAISSYAPQNGYLADEITLNAENIDPSINYLIKVNGIEAGYATSTETVLKFRIPSATTSGNITVEYDNIELDIGPLEVVPSTDELYVYYADGYGCSPPDLLTLYKADLSNGEIVEVLGPIINDCDEHRIPFLYNPGNNTYVYSYCSGGPNIGGCYSRVANLTTNTISGFSTFELLNPGGPYLNYKYLGFLGQEDIYYGKYEVDIVSGIETVRLVARDLQTQNEAYLFDLPVMDYWDTNWNLGTSCFIPSINNFIAFTPDVNDELVFLKIDIDAQNMIIVPDPNNGTIQEILITSDDHVYGINKIGDTAFEIVQLDPETGEIIVVFETIEAGYFRNLNYSESSNRFFAAYAPQGNYNYQMESIYMLSLDTGIQSFLSINNNSYFHGFMLNN